MENTSGPLSKSRTPAPSKQVEMPQPHHTQNWPHTSAQQSHLERRSFNIHHQPLLRVFTRARGDADKSVLVEGTC